MTLYQVNIIRRLKYIADTYIIVFQEPQCAMFRRIFACSPAGLIRKTMLLSGFIIATMRHFN